MFEHLELCCANYGPTGHPQKHVSLYRTVDYLVEHHQTTTGCIYLNDICVNGLNTAATELEIYVSNVYPDHHISVVTVTGNMFDIELPSETLTSIHLKYPSKWFVCDFVDKAHCIYNFAKHSKTGLLIVTSMFTQLDSFLPHFLHSIPSTVLSIPYIFPNGEIQHKGKPLSFIISTS